MPKVPKRPRLRGPAFARAKRKFTIPPVTIESIAKDYDCPESVWCQPAIPLKRVKVAARREHFAYVALGERMDTIDEPPEISLALGLSVLSCAALTPETWDLVGGAEFRPARTIAARFSRRRGGKKKARGKARIAPSAHLRTDLPERTLTFDISYPLNRYARVTIKPYTVACGRGFRGVKYKEEMTVGYVLYQLAQAYKQIYTREREFGVHSHDIGDLSFGGLSILDNIGEVGVDS